MHSSGMDTLTDRQLNRATLARQMLLERSDIGIAEAVRVLGGLQAQQSNDPYIALWSRLRDFRQDDLTALIVGKTLLRATSMRATLHLHPADDLLGMRPMVADFLKAMWRSNFKKRFGDEDETDRDEQGDEGRRAPPRERDRPDGEPGGAGDQDADELAEPVRHAGGDEPGGEHAGDDREAALREVHDMRHSMDDDESAADEREGRTHREAGDEVGEEVGHAAAPESPK